MLLLLLLLPLLLHHLYYSTTTTTTTTTTTLAYYPDYDNDYHHQRPPGLVKLQPQRQALMLCIFLFCGNALRASVLLCSVLFCSVLHPPCCSPVPLDHLDPPLEPPLSWKQIQNYHKAHWDPFIRPVPKRTCGGSEIGKYKSLADLRALGNTENKKMMRDQA